MKRIITIFAVMVGLLSPALLGAGASAAGTVFGDACKDNPDSVICKQADPASAKTNTNTFIQNIISTLLFALGIVAVVAIIVGGIRYATSDGDASKVKQAKDTILYAVIGLIVALLAYSIVNFVVGRF